VPNPYEPDFDFPYNAATPNTGASSNSPVNLNLGQVPDVEDPALALALLDIHNALELLQTSQGSLTSATGDQIGGLESLALRVTTVEGNITAIDATLVAVGAVLVDFEARIAALEAP
jgi:hypothetical protein